MDGEQQRNSLNCCRLNANSFPQDTNNDVLGYAYFMVSDGMLLSGSEPSS